MEKFDPNRRVLYVDDEDQLLSAFRSLMRREALDITTLNDPLQVEQCLVEQGPFAVVLSDQRMPGIEGVEVLRRVAALSPETVRIMVTGFADYEATLRAINTGGISHHVAKPWDDDGLRTLVRSCVQRYNLAGENTFLLAHLQAQNRELEELLEGTVVHTTRMLGDLVGYVNAEAASQVERVRRLGDAALRVLTEWRTEECWSFERALDLFNLGLALLPAWAQARVAKEGVEAANSIAAVRNHHLLAATLLEEVPRFTGVAEIIRFKQKSFDGSGEPVDDRRAGSEIPNGARLLRILIDQDRLLTRKVPGRAALERMRGQKGVYDEILIQRLLGEASTIALSSIEQSLRVGDLREGMMVLDDVIASDGLCLLKEGAVLNRSMLKILVQWHRRTLIKEPLRVRASDAGGM